MRLRKKIWETSSEYLLKKFRSVQSIESKIHNCMYRAGKKHRNLCIVHVGAVRQLIKKITKIF